MDSEHRHELKRNELAQWLSDMPTHIKNAPGYLKDNWFHAICVLLIVAAVLMWLSGDEKKIIRDVAKQAELTSVYQNISKTKSEIIAGEDTSGSLLSIAGELESLASTAKTSNHEAVALIKSADALRSDLHYRIGTVDEATVIEQIARARDQYEKALGKVKKNPTIKAMAEYGIALCAEEVRNFDEAQELYAAIAGNPDYQATIFAGKAEMKLANIEDAKAEFEFEATQSAVEEEVEEATEVK